MEEMMKTLLDQEARLQFVAFDENTAWKLGSAIVAEATARALPIAIDIRRGDRQLFHAAHGGCFPIIVRGTGMVGTVAVSRLPQEEDHRLVTECVAALLGLR